MKVANDFVLPRHNHDQYHHDNLLEMHEGKNEGFSCFRTGVLSPPVLAGQLSSVLLTRVVHGRRARSQHLHTWTKITTNELDSGQPVWRGCAVVHAGGCLARAYHPTRSPCIVGSEIQEQMWWKEHKSFLPVSL